MPKAGIGSSKPLSTVLSALCLFCSVLSVPLEEIVTPGLTMRVAGEGLPIPGGGKVITQSFDDSLKELEIY